MITYILQFSYKNNSEQWQDLSDVAYTDKELALRIAQECQDKGYYNFRVVKVTTTIVEEVLPLFQSRRYTDNPRSAEDIHD